MGALLCGLSSFTSNVLYYSEKFVTYIACGSFVVCMVLTLLITLGLGIGLGYNYCFVDIKTRHRYIPTQFRSLPGYGNKKHPIDQKWDFWSYQRKDQGNKETYHVKSSPYGNAGEVRLKDFTTTMRTISSSLTWLPQTNWLDKRPVIPGKAGGGDTPPWPPYHRPLGYFWR